MELTLVRSVFGPVLPRCDWFRLSFACDNFIFRQFRNKFHLRWGGGEGEGKKPWGALTRPLMGQFERLRNNTSATFRKNPLVGDENYTVCAGSGIATVRICLFPSEIWR